MKVTFYDANLRLRQELGANFGRVLARFVSGGLAHDPVVVEIVHLDRPQVDELHAELLTPDALPEGVSEELVAAAKRYYARGLASEGRRVHGYEHEPAAAPGTAWSVEVKALG